MTRPMEHAAASLEKIVVGALRRSPPQEAPVLAWPLVCGAGVAARTRALDFAKGILRVEVQNVGWRAELQSLAPRYVAEINRYVAETVKRIEFVLAAPSK